MARSPATLQELLYASARGERVGLAGDVVNLAWTLGALGTLDSVEATLNGDPEPLDLRGQISGWLYWLRNADLQQRISFFPSQNGSGWPPKRWTPSPSTPRFSAASSSEPARCCR